MRLPKKVRFRVPRNLESQWDFKLSGFILGVYLRKLTFVWARLWEVVLMLNYRESCKSP